MPDLSFNNVELDSLLGRSGNFTGSLTVSGSTVTGSITTTKFGGALSTVPNTTFSTFTFASVLDPLTGGSIVTITGIRGANTIILTYSTNSSGVITPAGVNVTVNLTNTAAGIAPCFVRGTLISTPAGERPVESLRIGDLVVTAAGEEKPVIWIGTRSYAPEFASKKVWPVRIAAGALDDNLPKRDLLVSPCHGVLVDGLLIPAIELVNGLTITQGAIGEQIDYFHLELEEHDLVMAEGVPNETFVDDGSRMLFHNAHEYYALHPHRDDVDAVYATVRVEDGEELQAVRERLTARAGLLQAAA